MQCMKIKFFNVEKMKFSLFRKRNKKMSDNLKLYNQSFDSCMMQCSQLLITYGFSVNFIFSDYINFISILDDFLTFEYHRYSNDVEPNFKKLKCLSNMLCFDLLKQKELWMYHKLSFTQCIHYFDFSNLYEKYLKLFQISTLDELETIFKFIESNCLVYQDVLSETEILILKQFIKTYYSTELKAQKEILEKCKHIHLPTDIINFVIKKYLYTNKIFDRNPLLIIPSVNLENVLNQINSCVFGFQWYSTPSFRLTFETDLNSYSIQSFLETTLTKQKNNLTFYNYEQYKGLDQDRLKQALLH